VLVALAALLPGSAKARVSRGFVGMMADGPVFAQGMTLDSVLSQMVASGVGRVRVAFSWAEAQPYARWSDVPPGLAQHYMSAPNGVPTAYYRTDLIVAEAAAHHLPLLPVVTYAPPWDASAEGDHRQPVRDGPYGDYLKALVERYGPRGSFWASHPSVPKEPIR
jgi:hypothetical protein